MTSAAPQAEPNRDLRAEQTAGPAVAAEPAWTALCPCCDKVISIDTNAKLLYVITRKCVWWRRLWYLVRRR